MEEAAPGEPENYLIVGSDSRENIDPDDPSFGDVLPGVVGGQRSDTIMVARIDPADTQVHIVSFPRDLFLELSTGETTRINAAYGQGRQVLIDTIQQNFGIAINHYVEIDFTGFQRLVDAIGGVPVYLDAAYRDERSSLVAPIGPGCVTLDGTTALGLRPVPPPRAPGRGRRLGHRPHRRPRADHPPAVLHPQGRRAGARPQPVHQPPARSPSSSTWPSIRCAVDSGLSNDDLRGLASSFDGFDPSTIVNHALPGAFLHDQRRRLRARPRGGSRDRRHLQHLPGHGAR